MFGKFARAVVPLVVLAVCMVVAYVPRTAVPPLVEAHKALGPYGYAFFINSLWIILPIATLALQRGSLRAALADLGISTNPLRPLFFGLVATAPASIGFALTAHVAPSIDPRAFFLLCVYGPFAEEVLFRAFAFGQFYRHCEWRFPIAALLPAVLFAAAHARQATNIADLGQILAITALGSLVFSYFFVRLGWTIWAPFALHALLNIWWTIFTNNPTAAGGITDNIFRFGSIGLGFGLAYGASRISAFRIFAPKEGAWRADPA